MTLTPALMVCVAALTNPADQPATKAVPAADVLAQRVTHVVFDDAPLAEVFEWLRAHGDINVLPLWRGMPAVDEDDPVQLEMADVTVAEVLDEVLAQLDDEGELTYHATGRTIRISSVAALNRRLVVRVYSVRDLLQRLPSYGDAAPTIDLQQAMQVASGGGGGRSAFTGGNQGRSEGGEASRDEEQRRVDELVLLIKTAVAPGTWGDDNRAGPQVMAYGTNLVVRAGVEAHEAIAGYFDRGE